jgi:ATP-dependent protease ClpP protease subunit
MKGVFALIASASLLIVSALAFVVPTWRLIVPEDVDLFYWICMFCGALAVLLSLAVSVKINAGPHGNLLVPRNLTSLFCVVLLLPTVGFFAGLIANKSSIISILTSYKDYVGAEVSLESDESAILDGLIGTSTLPSLQAMVSEKPIKYLVLRSGGGLVESAIELADYLRSKRISSVNVTYCKSACVIVALSGQPLYASPNAVFGFHQGSSIASENSQIGRLIGKFATDNLISTLRVRGVPEKVLDKAMKTPPDKMLHLTGREMFDLGLVKHLLNNN